MYVAYAHSHYRYCCPYNVTVKERTMPNASISWPVKLGFLDWTNIQKKQLIYSSLPLAFYII